MANREELLVIRAARAGQAPAQLALGKRYLFGGAGLPKSATTALYWLDRAAHQQEDEAWLLIGSHIPFEAASRVAQPASLCVWYERAFDSGILQAGLVLAKLVLAQAGDCASDNLRRKAWMALEAVAHAGFGEAQWLMAQLIGHANGCDGTDLRALSSHSFHSSTLKMPANDSAKKTVLEWTVRAADGGVARAQYALAEQAWDAGNHDNFLRWALPLARQAMLRKQSRPMADSLDEPMIDESSLLAHCCEVLMARGNFDAIELECFLEAAASAGDRQSCLALGLWFGRMDGNGTRLTEVRGLANYKKALRWLVAAGEQGLAEAWFATSRIYLKPEFSQRNLLDSNYYVQKAAEAGHTVAQLELGMAAWRSRRNDQSKDVEAAFWLQKAATQGNEQARHLIQKITDVAVCASWAEAATKKMVHDKNRPVPFLVARLELAVIFGLSRAEALLLNVNAADCGHCLLIDIRDIHPRSKRRLILIQSSAQRQALSRLVRLFDDVDCSIKGPEGNYRQRLYRLRVLVPE
jgi:TPR repeat protein